MINEGSTKARKKSSKKHHLFFKKDKAPDDKNIEIQPNTLDANGLYPLQNALTELDTQKFEKLLSEGADVNLIVQHKKTLARWVVEQNSKEFIQILYKHQCKLFNEQDEKGRTLWDFVDSTLKDEPELKALFVKFPDPSLKSTPPLERKSKRKSSKKKSKTIFHLNEADKHRQLRKEQLEKVAQTFEHLNELLTQAIIHSKEKPKRKLKNKKELKEIDEQQTRLSQLIENHVFEHKPQQDWISFSKLIYGLTVVFSPDEMIGFVRERFVDLSPLQQLNALYFVKEILFIEQLNLSLFVNDHREQESELDLFIKMLSSAYPQLKQRFKDLNSHICELHQLETSEEPTKRLNVEETLDKVGKGSLSKKEYESFKDKITLDLVHRFSSIFLQMDALSKAREPEAVGPLDIQYHHKPLDVQYNELLERLSQSITFDIIKRPLNEARNIFQFYFELAQIQYEGNPYFNAELNSFVAIVLGLDGPIIKRHKALQDTLKSDYDPSLAQRVQAIINEKVDIINQFTAIRERTLEQTSRAMVPYLGLFLKEDVLRSEAQGLNRDEDPLSIEGLVNKGNIRFQRAELQRYCAQLDTEQPMLTDFFERLQRLEEDNHLSTPFLRETFFKNWLNLTPSTQIDHVKLYLDNHDSLDEQTVSKLESWRQSKIKSLHHEYAAYHKEELPVLLRERSFSEPTEDMALILERLERVKLTAVLSRKHPSQYEGEDDIESLAESLEELKLESPKKSRRSLSDGDTQTPPRVMELLKEINELKHLQPVIESKVLKGRHKSLITHNFSRHTSSKTPSFKKSEKAHLKHFKK